MAVRIIVGFVLLPLIPIVLFFAPAWVLPLVIALISALGVQELLGATGFVKKKRIVAYSAVIAALIPLWTYFDLPSLLGKSNSELAIAGLALFLLVLFIEGIIDHNNITFGTISTVFTVSLIVPLFFSSLIRIENMSFGKHVIMLPLIAAFLGDTCAYFTGSAFGKHKLKPDISPKKTIEGCVGGIAGTVIGMLVYGLVEQFVFLNSPNYFLLALMGIIGSLVGIVGDLSMSLIKRECRIKDFSSLLPGHGGIMDRFDSLLFVAPIIEVMLTLLPVLLIVN